MATVSQLERSAASKHESRQSILDIGNLGKPVDVEKAPQRHEGLSIFDDVEGPPITTAMIREILDND